MIITGCREFKYTHNLCQDCRYRFTTVAFTMLAEDHTITTHIPLKDLTDNMSGVII
jgi:C4-type Zn-finger protein